jgi:hypothetical protein
MKMSKFGPNTWLGNMGASAHYINNDVGMFDVQVINEPIKIGNGNSMTATKIGKLRRTIIQRNRESMDVVLTDVKYVPGLWVNLFSIGKALSSGFQIGNNGLMIHLTKGVFKMSFDHLMPTKKGYAMGIDMVPVAQSIATAALDCRVRVNINALHGMLGHVGKDAITKTGAYYGWILTGTCEDCNHCGTAKAKQSNLNKIPVDKSKTCGERLFINISSIKAMSYGQSKFWLLALDDCTDYSWSFYLRRKAI